MSPRQKDLVGTIERMTREHGYPPTMAEVAKSMNVSRTRIDTLARECQRKGALAWQPGKARSWKILQSSINEPQAG